MSKKLMSGLFGAGAVLAAQLFAAGVAQAQEHQGLTITTPADGATVAAPVTVAFSAGEGGGQHGEHHGHGGGGGRQVFLIIDQPAPEPGSTIEADQNHIAFPEDERQTTVTLAPGKHTLILAALDREGHVGRRFHAAEPVTVTVQ